jgi:transcriptional regulator GlxA family with amidase domain
MPSVLADSNEILLYPPVAETAMASQVVVQPKLHRRQRGTDSMDSRVTKILHLLVTHPGGRQPRRSELARAVNLSPSRLSHLFKSETGVSIGSFARTRRIDVARTLLATSFLSVKEIAAVTGAGDPSHFVRNFRRAVGMTPGSYRRSTQVRQLAQSADK